MILYRQIKWKQNCSKKFAVRFVKKRIASVLLAVAIVLAAGGIGHYWYYDKENYISWDEANISVKDGKVYSTVNPLGRMKSILSVDQKNMFLHAVRNHVDPQRISIRFKHRK